MKKLSLFLFGAVFLLGCNSAPMFSQSEGETMSQDFFALVKTDPQAAYQETSADFQGVSSEQDFLDFAQGDIAQHLTDITIDGISFHSSAYDSDYNGPMASIVLSGEGTFDDGSSDLVEIDWFYDFDNEVWEVTYFEFNPKD